MVARPLARLLHAWRRHGLRMFGPMIVHNLRHYGRQWISGSRVGQPRSVVDSIPGVETHRAVYLTALGFTGLSGVDAQPYEPVTDDDFQAMVNALPIEPERFTFVDLGSGKGRALLLAVRSGFMRVIGVEFSPELHGVAQRNLAAARPHWPHVGRIELVCGDAAEYVPPAAPVVCYLFNPFGANVMSRVIDTWTRNIASHSHDLWVVYRNPTQGALFEASEAFQLQFSVAGFAVFRRTY